MEYNAKIKRWQEEVYSLLITMPPAPPLEEMGNYGLPLSEQKFKRTLLPEVFRSIQRDDSGQPVWTKEQRRFIIREGFRRIHGYWFLCKGQPTYITGNHYFELNYWNIPLDQGIGLKEYRDKDRRVHIFFEECLGRAYDYSDNDYYQTYGKYKRLGWKQPNCYGALYMKPRRDGATHRSNSIHFNTISTEYGATGGMQSKKGTDAKKVFTFLVNSWRRVPEFFQPIFDGNTAPKGSLRFFEPATSSVKDRGIKEDNSLNSEITYENTVEEAYDGQGLRFYHGNEFGKTTEMNVSDCWDIVRECLTLGKKIRGKSLIETTVEEMEKKGGKHFKDIWDNSDHKSLNQNGRTSSGLWRLFIPAYDGLEGFIDEYGYSMIEEAKQFLLNNRQGYIDKQDFKKLASYKRKYPFTEKESFSVSADDCLYSREKLEARIQELIQEQSLGLYWLRIKRGNLEWENGIKDTRVVWQPDPDGRFEMAYLPPKDEQNNLTTYRGFVAPNNTAKYVIGADPMKFGGSAGSKMAFYVHKKYNILDEGKWHNDQLVLQYLKRPELAEVAYEDLIKTCWFFGAEALIENQTYTCIKYLMNREKGNFIMDRPDSTITKYTNTITEGIAASKPVHQQIVEVTAEHIYNRCDTVPFLELLQDWLDFDVNNTQKFDPSMAAGYTFIGKTKVIKKQQTVNLDDFGIHKYRM